MVIIKAWGDCDEIIGFGGFEPDLENKAFEGDFIANFPLSTF